ncbi:MAG: excinuclease ABC subunit UvrA, partial [Paludibacteraceae bacterium]|nr:excinuclease ABC subunit UvrA [Paludibacteraceae bacterium]
MLPSKGNIEVIGARVHNLKNISVSIPRKRLTVITGLSGSGKSSLAFDTIFAEGQRRYMETFSSYARGFIGNMQRPDVDKITGLSPVISIDQKTTTKNPRSTVGTITEVYDFLRLLYARAGQAYSYLSGKPMIKFTDEQIIDLIIREYGGKKILLLAPLVNGRKGHYKELFETIRKKGFVHVRVDGEVQEIVAGMKLDRYKTHSIEVVVDRLKVKGERLKDEGTEDDLRRIRQSVDRAMTQGNGIMMIADEAGNTRFMSRNLMCPETGLSYQEPAPHTFSFNSPSGWCPCCKGLGKIKSSEISLPQSDTFDEAIQQDNWWEELQELSATTISEEEEEQEEYVICPECHGKRLSKEALSYRLGKYSISDLSEMDIDELITTLERFQDPSEEKDEEGLSSKQRAIAEPILKEIITRLRFMQSVGLSYLSLNRSSESLSGGESQRIRLATQIGSRLVNVLYILDEPSIGLHQRDNQRLIDSLKELRDMNNSVIVVEHDEQMMREADWIVDIGPKAGRLGGNVLFSGTPEDLLKTDTLTAQYLKGNKTVTDVTVGPSEGLLDRSADRPATPVRFITLSGCTGNNLKNVTVKIPLGQMVCVTGVSGSGKSTLINQTLYPILSQKFYRSKTAPLPYKSIEGVQFIDKIINVDQSPIGRTPRSNPATYTNV